MLEVNDKVFELMEALKTMGLIEFDSDFCAAIGLQKQNLTPIKNKKKFFTIKHISMMSKVYNANPNWIFGLEKNMFRKVAIPEKSKI
ncbi:hypothetical protein [Flavobacterium sp.]